MPAVNDAVNYIEAAGAFLYNNGQMPDNKVFINDQGLLEIHVVGDQTYDTVMQMGQEMKRLIAELESQHKPVLVLDDVTRMERTNTGARQAVNHIARTFSYKKAAMVGSSAPLMRYGTMLLLQAIGMGQKIKYFDDQQAAIDWLKS